MKVAERNWMQIEDQLGREDRAVLPLGSVEQHAYLSLAVDAILSERVASEAAEPLGVPVFPALPYGITPSFRAYPGTLSLRVATYLRVITDLLDGLREQGFRRILVVNGHGGNTPAQSLAAEWMGDHPEVQVLFHNWWNASKTWSKVLSVDPLASHASWMENFPWTRLAGVEMPDLVKPATDTARMRAQAPRQVRALLGDGNYGGRYPRSDQEMLAIWQVAVEETRELLQGGWA